jgi:stage II sporulation protein D
LEILEQSTAGRIKTLRLGGKRLSGTFVRSQLKLASTRFTMQLAKDGAIQIETTGYGHAVGLCQRGSDALAKQKIDFAEILQHYYPGTELAQLKIESTKKNQFTP